MKGIIKIKQHILLLIGMSIPVFGQQTAEQIVRKSTEAYLSKDYITQTVVYNSYNDYTTTKPDESHTGVIIKKGNSHYAKISTMEMISTGLYGIQINHDLHTVIIAKGATTNKQGILQLVDYLKGFKGSVKQTSDYYICEFVPPVITQIMINKVVLKIKKSDYSLQSQTYYYTEEKETKDEKGAYHYAQPRLEIRYQPRKEQQAADEKLMQSHTYFTVKDQKIKLASQYQKYELIAN